MQQVDTKFNIKFDKILKQENLVDLFSPEQLQSVAAEVIDGFNKDMQSRSEWSKRMETALKMAVQYSETKNWPWEKASNVKFPLITISALQFSARAYPALIPSTSVVKTKMVGEITPEKTDRATRIAKHMSYQVLEEDEDWEQEMDRLLVVLPVVGCSFKKSYFDRELDYVKSTHVLASDLVVNYKAKSLRTCRRKTHKFYLEHNDVVEKMRMKTYRMIDDLADATVYSDPQTQAQDDAQGVTDNSDEPQRLMLEQHCYFDFDGDGYKEPYVVTVDWSTESVMRIIKRFEVEDVVMSESKVARIKPTEYFTKYGLIPSPDGGFYDLGFGALLGPNSAAIDSIINQLIDAGTLKNLGGGFLGRGIRVKKGDMRRKVGEWTPVNNTGDDLRKGIFPLPVGEPSQTLFQLLGLLIDYSERVSSVSDIMAGQSPGQNQPATTSMAVLEQGMKVFSGIFKRVHRSMRDEFRVRYNLNRIYMHPESQFYVGDEVTKIFQVDYTNANEILPASDPSMISETQSMLQAEALVARAAAVPGYNVYEVEKQYLTSMRIDNIEQVYPDPQGPNAIQSAPDPKVVLETQKQLTLQLQVKSNAAIKFAELSIQAAETEALISKYKAESLKLIADAESAEVGDQLDEYRAQIEAMVAQRDNIKIAMEIVNGERDRAAAVEAPASDGGGMASPA
jgi:chaperonin GroES